MTTAPAPLLTAEGAPAASAWTLDPSIRHLNHGSFGAVPRSAQRAQNELRRAMESDPNAWFPRVPARIAAARADIARFLGADVDALALVPNASAGVTVAYRAIDAFPGMEIVMTDHAYGAVAMGAERLARRHGGRVVTVRVPIDADDAAVAGSVAGAITPRTALVVVDQVTSATARRFPVADIVAAAHENGVPVLVDAAHAPGMFRDPLAGIDADYWVGNLHKFACAPRGTAALVVRGAERERVSPLIDSWGAPYPFPESFDHQGTLDPTSYLAAPVSLETIEQRFGWEVVRDYMASLGDYAEQLVSSALGDAGGYDARVDVGAPVPALRLVRLPSHLARTADEAHALRAVLSEQAGVETAITSWGGAGYLRLSVHAYNTASDYEDFAERIVPMLVELG